MTIAFLAPSMDGQGKTSCVDGGPNSHPFQKMPQKEISKERSAKFTNDASPFCNSNHVIQGLENLPS